MSDVVDGEAVEEHEGELVPYVPAPHAGGTLIKADDPADFIAHASRIASALAEVVRKQNLVANIRGKEHVQVEAWTLLGSMLGVFPVTVWTRELPNGWEARVEARTLAGQVVGAGEAMCTREESRWKSADAYAIRSMAATRATSRAMRSPLGFVMTLAGFEATPAEEMPDTTAEPPAPADPYDFDPATKLLPGAPTGKGWIDDGMNMLAQVHPLVEWPKVITQATEACFGVAEFKQIPKEKVAEFGTRFANACRRMHDEAMAADPNQLPPLSEQEMKRVFAWAFGGAVVDLPMRPEKSDV